MFTVPISRIHDRKSFDCGEPALNDFLVRRGLSEIAGSTTVVVSDPGSTRIMAYYTVNPNLTSIVAGEHAGRPLLSQLVTLEYLAVDKQYQSKHIGTDLLILVMRQVVEISEEYKIDALAVEPLNIKSRQWFMSRDFGFLEASIHNRKMLLLPVATIRAALSP